MEKRAACRLAWLQCCAFACILVVGEPRSALATTCRLDYILRSGPQVAGQVFGPDLKKRPGHGILIRSPRGFGAPARALCSVTTDANGFFECPLLPKGSYLVYGVHSEPVQLSVEDGHPFSLWAIKVRRSESPCSAPPMCGVEMPAPVPLDDAPACLSKIDADQLPKERGAVAPANNALNATSAAWHDGTALAR